MLLTFKQFIKLNENVEHPMLDVDGEMKHVNNSEGKRIHPTDDGIRNFHRWFKDSKTVDEHGRPLVMYRGQSKEYSDEHDSTNPIWVTPHKEYAHLYTDNDGSEDSNQNMMKVYAKSKNPINLGFRSLHTDVKFKDVSDRAKDNILNDYNDSKISKESALEAIKHLQAGVDHHKDIFSPVQHFQDKSTHLHNALKTAGYDSLSATEGDDKYSGKSPKYNTYGILHKNNIKSAIGNSGNFSKDKDSITEDNK